jgi:hypothetical protein
MFLDVILPFVLKVQSSYHVVDLYHNLQVITAQSKLHIPERVTVSHVTVSFHVIIDVVRSNRPRQFFLFLHRLQWKQEVEGGRKKRNKKEWREWEEGNIREKGY